MKKVIEEIEKIKGVEKVTETGCNELTVQVEIIEPELELISGEIYCSKEGDMKWIFRLECDRDKIGADYYSIIDYENDFNVGSYLCHADNVRTIKPATNKQKAKLIKAELKNGYLWNGKELIKYK